MQALEDIKKAGCNALCVYLGNFGPEISETRLAKHFDGPAMFIAADGFSVTTNLTMEITPFLKWRAAPHFVGAAQKYGLLYRAGQATMGKTNTVRGNRYEKVHHLPHC